MDRLLRPVVILLAIALNACAPGFVARYSSPEPTTGSSGQGKACLSAPASAGLRRLTQFEVARQFREVFGVDLDRNLLPADGINQLNLNRDGATQFFLSSDAERLFDTFSAAVGTVTTRAALPLFQCSTRPAAETASCLRPQYQALLQKLWRKPPVAADVDRALTFHSAGATFNQAVQNAVLYALLSPHFLTVYVSSSAARLSSSQLAERMALFLTGGAPDAQLTAAAGDNSILNSEVAAHHVRRLLENPEVRFNFINEFVGQWLGSLNLQPSPGSSVNGVAISSSVVSDMHLELVWTLDEMLRDNRPIKDLLSYNFTIASADLAKLYGLTWAPGGRYDAQGRFAKINFGTGFPRRGLLTSMAAQMVSGHAKNGEVNPVFRGLWFSSRFLCRTPGAPPADVAPLPAGPSTADLSIKEILREHTRKSSSCYACHQFMDPIGFGFFNYGAFGEYRTRDARGFVIDPSGDLAGKAFSSAEGLVQIFSEGEDVSHCLTAHLVNFATSKYFLPQSSCEIREIASQSMGLKDLFVNLVNHPSFTAK